MTHLLGELVPRHYFNPHEREARDVSETTHFCVKGIF